MKKTIVISAYPASGKSYTTVHQEKYRIKDLDSSTYSKVEREHTQKEIAAERMKWESVPRFESTEEHMKEFLKEKVIDTNPHFPDNYIRALKELIQSGEYDVIFVSSHISVRKCLADNNIPFICVLPVNDECVRNEFIGRMFIRGNDNAFIRNMVNNWDLHTSGQGFADEAYTYRLGNGDYIDEEFIEDLLSEDDDVIEDAIY